LALVALSVIEQRYRPVLLVLDGRERSGGRGRGFAPVAARVGAPLSRGGL